MKKTITLCVTVAAALTLSCRREEPKPAEAPNVASDDVQRIETMARRFALVDLTADISSLPQNEREALGVLVRAAKVFDALYLRQVWEENETMLLDLARDTSPLGQARMHYFLINKGPWSRLDHNEAFILGVPPKPERGNFYPAATKKEIVEKWINSLPDGERRRATGFFTTIRMDAQGKFIIVPYNVEYQNELTRVAVLLRQAAKITLQPTLKNYL